MTLVKKEVEEPADWDKRKIAVALLVLGVLLVVFLESKRLFLDKNKTVLGETAVKIEQEAVKPPNINISSQIAPKVQDIKKSVEGLNVEEVATSSPQIQKVLNDIKGIKDLPANQAKDACFKICSGL